MHPVETKCYLSTLHKFRPSWKKFLNCPACEFTAHYACKNIEINLKSTTSNGFSFGKINSFIESWGVRLTWLECKWPPDPFISPLINPPWNNDSKQLVRKRLIIGYKLTFCVCPSCTSLFQAFSWRGQHQKK